MKRGYKCQNCGSEYLVLGSFTDRGEFLYQPAESPTPHEVRGMPAGKTLDHLIALRTGWERFEDGWKSPVGFTFDETFCFGYSKSLDASIKLMDKVRELHHLEFTLNSARDAWRACFWVQERWGDESFCAIGETRPLAIARAALLVLLDKEKP